MNFVPPLLLDVPQHRKSQNRIFFAVSPVFSPTNFWANFRKENRTKIDTESCPSGRRCSTRNPPQLRLFHPPVSLCFQGFSWVLKTKYFVVLTRRSNILVFPLFWGSRCSDRVWHTRSGIEVVITRTTRNRGRYPVAPWPETLDFMEFFGYS